MSLKLTEEQKKQLQEDKEHAKKVLKDKALFDKAFEEAFNTYDKNHDGRIDFVEYNEFLQSFLAKMGRKCYNIANVTMHWDRADRDKNGEIDRDEFKKEFMKRMNEFANL